MVLDNLWNAISCGSSEAAREQLDRSEIDPRLAAAHRGFEVLGEPAVAVKPSKGSLDHPAPRQDREAGGVIGALDNLDPPLPVPGQCHCQLVTGVSAIREDMAQPRKQVADRGQQVRRSIPILSVGGMDLAATRCPAVSVRMWRLRPLIFLPAS